MKSCIIPLLIILLCFSSSAFLVEPNDCGQPLLVEYISNYEIPTNDLKDYIETNFSSFDLDNMKNSNASFTSIKAGLKYIDGSKHVDPISPMKLNVTDDSFSMTLTWEITVSEKYIKDRHYKANVEITPILTSYLKFYEPNSNKFNISDFHVLFKEEMIQNIVYNDTLQGKDEEKIKSLIKNEFFNKISAQFNTFSHWLQVSAAKQRIAIAFPDTVYHYQFDQTKIEINTATLSLSKEDNITYVNGYKGIITGQAESRCPDSTPHSQPEYSLYISDSFIENFISTSLRTHQGYQKMIFDSKLKTGNFQWKLLDLEFVLEDFGNYEDKIMNNINFECSVRPDFSMSFKENSFRVFTTWDCKGNLEIAEGSSVQIIDSTFKFIDNIELYIQVGSLQATQRHKILESSEYREVSGLKVKDSKQADTFVKYLIRFWPSRVIGDQFKVQPQNTKVKVEENKAAGTGIWIG